jgi:hypothetical protein
MSTHFAKLGRPKFTLRAMFVAVMLVGCWLGWNYHQVNERTRLRKDLGRRGARLYSPAFFQLPGSQPSIASQRLPIVWKWFGAYPLDAIVLPVDQFGEDDRQRIQALFPEAEVSLEPLDSPGSGKGFM